MISGLLRLLICGLLLISGGQLYATGGRTGNAGDWRQMMLGSAQREAANWTNTVFLNQDVLSEIEDLGKYPLLASFFTYPDSLKTLALDIVSSRHIYIDEDSELANAYHTCAWTNDPTAESMTDIVFTLERCEAAFLEGGQSFANRLLIHESVHHLLRQNEFVQLITSKFEGTEEDRYNQEETFCDLVASTIQQAFELVAQKQKPHWRDIAIPVFLNESLESVSIEARGFHATVWTGQTGDTLTENRMIIWGGCSEGEATIYACGGESYFNNGAIYNPADDTWTQITADQAPSSRASMLALWTGNSDKSNLRDRMIVFGGCRQGDGCQERLNDGGIYDPQADRWEPINADDRVLSPRVHHNGVWTGSQLIVWGGHPNPDPSSPFLPAPVGDGAIYDPQRKTWQKIPDSLADSPSARAFHAAIWTGETGNPESANKMFVWGGCVQEIADACSKPFNDGAFFDPRTLTWSRLQASGLAPKARHNGSVLYVESQAKVYIFGGVDANGHVLSDGFILDLKTLSWSPMAMQAVGRFKQNAVWAGDRMIIFGGKTFNQSTRDHELVSDVVAYIPSSTPNRHGRSGGRWITYETLELAPLKAIETSTIWTGDSLLVWGGQILDRGFTSSGSRFFPGFIRK